MLETNIPPGASVPILPSTFIFPRGLMNTLVIDFSKISEHIIPVTLVHKINCCIPFVF